MQRCPHTSVPNIHPAMWAVTLSSRRMVYLRSGLCVCRDGWEAILLVHQPAEFQRKYCPNKQGLLRYNQWLSKDKSLRGAVHHDFLNFPNLTKLCLPTFTFTHIAYDVYFATPQLMERINLTSAHHGIPSMKFFHETCRPWVNPG